MGELSKAVFGRTELPKRCILYGGAYSPERKDVVRALFDEWTRVRGTWVRHAYAKACGKEYLVLFNVYGGATVLDTLHLLKDGDARRTFFIGSMYAKELPIGTLVVPNEVVDRAGLVLLDSPRKSAVRPDRAQLSELRSVLETSGMSHTEAKIVSVPAVLHNIEHIRALVEEDKDIEGVEMEVSTFYHFSRKLGMDGYALLYVSDNRRFGVISKAEVVRKARRDALRSMTRVGIETLVG